MSLHKLSAGDGYTYLTRQVAAGDSTERGYTSLGDYYTARGETPGVWTGPGAQVLGVAGQQVTEQQMRNLFGEGIHPDAERVRAEHYAMGWSVPAAARATLLGAKFRVYEGDSAWRRRLGERYEAWNQVRGLPGDWPIPAEDRARIRTDTARDMFAEKHGRDPITTQELDGFLRQVSRQRSAAVAGYDLTFSPVKSVSALWAVAPLEISRAIEDAHQAAVARTLTWLGERVAYTRVGAGGVGQVDTDGLTCAAFTHRDSRAGDPDLHTHVAVSNKVRVAGTEDRWLALDGRMIHRYTVAGSEMYNTILEAEITARIGGRFAERPAEPGKRPVRELVGVDPWLNAAWSSRRVAITGHRERLVADFRSAHGRLPTAVEMVSLSQQATLATRQAKHEPRSLAEQRTAWNTEAMQFLGGPDRLARMLADVAAGRDPGSPTPSRTGPGGPRPRGPVTPREVAGLAAATVAAVAQSRALWSAHNLAAEAARQVRGRADLTAEQTMDLIERVAETAANPEHSIPVGVDADIEVEAPIPGALRRADGTSVYRMAGGQRYTSAEILDAEARIVAAAGARGARHIDTVEVELAGLEWSANHHGATLNTSQAALVRHVATSDRRVMLALAPAGTGKTTAMGVLTRAWQASGGTVVGLAPQASAAQTLGEAIGATGDTLDKLVYDITASPTERGRWHTLVGPDSLVIIDEAGLAATPKLDAAIRYTTSRGARVLLVGDDRQRAAAGAGGVLRDIETTHGALSLTEVLRFTDPAEAQVSLALRAGDPSAAAYYTDRGRLHPVSADEAADAVYSAWAADTAAGADSVMIAPTLEQVAELNTRARADRIAAAGAPTGREIHLANGETISAGDVIVTKRNARTLTLGGTDFVRNNDRWHINQVNTDGSVTATLLGRGAGQGVTRLLPAWYLRSGHVRLGYATTVASVQGLTVGRPGTRQGTAHAILADGMTRNDAYPALTRATDGTHVYVLSTRLGDPHDVIRPDALQPSTAAETLAKIVATDGSALSVTSAIRQAKDAAVRLGPAAAAYTHALATAAETLTGADEIAKLVTAAEAAIPGITAAPAWDLLREHLAVRHLTGAEPIADLTAAAARRELGTAADPAAVLDWRLDPTGNHSTPPGPLPWLPGIPRPIDDHPDWSHYLHARAALTVDLTEQVAADTAAWTPATAPGWALPYLVDRRLLADLAIWRAVHTIPDTDPRPAGPRPDTIADAARHRHLTHRAIDAAGDPTIGADRWTDTLTALGAHHLTDDDYWPVLTSRLNLADRTGLPVQALLRRALGDAPLPAEQPAAALWWRLAPHLGDLAGIPSDTHHLRPPWTHTLTTGLGPELADTITADRLWPAIVAKIDAAQRNGANPDTLATNAAALLAAHAPGLSPHHAAPALLWTISTLTDPVPADPTVDPLPPDPADADQQAPADATTAQPTPAAGHPTDAARPLTDADQPHNVELVPPDPIETEQAAILLEWEAEDYAAAQERIYQTLAAAHAFYTDQAPASWVPDYLTRRGLPADAAGYAPAGWTTVIDHLRAAGHADADIQAAGLAKTSSRGTLIDVFRDRAVLPIHNADGRVAAFIGRKPETNHDERTPKYLNSPGTAVFTKSDLPYGLDPQTIAALRAGADLAIVEGPMDALAVTAAAHASGRNVVAVAPNGTALTPGQLDTVNAIAPLGHRRVIVAMDSDHAGLAAAARAYPLLIAAGVTDPHAVTDWNGKDPAQTLTDHGPARLAELLDGPQPLADLAVDTILGRWPIGDGTPESRFNALREAAPLVAAMPVPEQVHQIKRLAEALNYNLFTAADAVLAAADLLPTMPRRHTTRQVDLPAPPQLTGNPARPGHVSEPTVAAAAAESGPPDQQWRRLLPTRQDILDDPHWPTLAAQLDRLQAAGHDVPTLISQIVSATPTTGSHPARDLDYAIAEMAYVPTPTPDQTDATAIAPASSAQTRPAAPRPRPPR